MCPTLDSCIAGIFTPGNIGASSGLPPVQPSVPSLSGSAPALFEAASATETLDYFMGQMLHEAANAVAVIDASLPTIHTVMIAEAAIAAEASVGTVIVATSTMTWNPADLSGMTLSNANLRATCTGNFTGVRGLAGYSSGKYYFEITANTFTSGYLGLARSTVDLTAGSTTNAVGVGSGGGIDVNGTNAGNINGVGTGTVVCIAVDLTAKLIWFRSGASGSWNATSGTANNPATGTGGISISALTGALFPWFCAVFGGAGQQVTANFGASTFAGAVPSGFGTFP